jgi:hypothetical protein
MSTTGSYDNSTTEMNISTLQVFLVAEKDHVPEQFSKAEKLAIEENHFV